MYESIRGTLLHRNPASAVIETAGLAYRVQIPLSTYESLPLAGEETTLLLHLVVREDEWRLYGFIGEEERLVFRALLRVNGVGPVMALGLLSGFQPAEFQATVAGGDVRGLTRVKGVGRKTAERIIVELRDVWKDAVGPVGVDRSVGDTSGPVEDAIRALESLGLDGAEARRRVTRHATDDSAAEGGVAADAATLIRLALRS